ncbi:MAG: hypothetical protein KDC87_07250 [Planctomycetes bacterium]|nr:hypothetical protein [Planctomycetota bacterium]
MLKDLARLAPRVRQWIVAFGAVAVVLLFLPLAWVRQLARITYQAADAAVFRLTRTGVPVPLRPQVARYGVVPGVAPAGRQVA